MYNEKTFLRIGVGRISQILLGICIQIIGDGSQLIDIVQHLTLVDTK